jgi:hypothetical protein
MRSALTPVLIATHGGSHAIRTVTSQLMDDLPLDDAVDHGRHLIPLVRPELTNRSLVSA